MRDNISAHRLLLAFILVITFAVVAPGQDAERTEEKPKALLVDEIDPVGDCEFGARVRRFMTRLSDNPDHQGYIINYESVKGPPELAYRERLITDHVAFRTYDRSRITLVNGGYHRDVFTEFWIVPPNAEHPKPSSTFPDRPAREADTILYERNFLDRRNFMNEFVLPSARAKPELGEDDSSPRDDVVSDEEKEEERFHWLELGIASRLGIVEKSATGVIRFYADERTYDIGRLTEFIDSARDRLANYGGINPARFRVEFGGYRPTPEVEFWIVRAGAKPPPVRQFERCPLPDK
jgi:hypothetical protein